MIDRDFAREQIERLAGLRNFPKDYAGAIKELIDAAQEAKSEPGCKSAIDQFAQYGEFCPTPADIRKAVWEKSEDEARERRAGAPREPRCEFCGDSGWRVVRKPYLGDNPHLQKFYGEGVEGVEPCTCRTGGARVAAAGVDSKRLM